MHLYDRSIKFAGVVLRRFHRERGLQLASSLTFTTLLALVPLLTVTLTIASAFPVFSGLTSHVDDFIASHMLPEQIGKTVLRYMDQFSQRAGRLTVIGLTFLGATAFLTMMTIERAFNLIWHASSRRPLLQRLVMYWAILTLGPLLIGVGVSMTSYLATASFGLVRGIPFLGWAALWLAPFALTITAFTLLYYVVPSKTVHIKHAFIGGVVAGILFEVAKRCFAIYVSQVPTYALVYGTFAAFPIFLFWIYLSWLVAVLGAIVTASLPNFNFADSDAGFIGARFVKALRVLFAAVDMHHGGKRAGLQELASAAQMRVETCEQLLEELAAAGWIGKIENENWALICSPHKIQLLDVIRRFLIDPSFEGKSIGAPEVGFAMNALGECLGRLSSISIQDVCTHQPQSGLISAVPERSTGRL